MNIDVVVTGHVDHGKSTLIGRLLYDSESIPSERLTEVQKLIQEYKKRFEFAYFIDSFEDEMKEERTIDTTAAIFKGKKNTFTVTDVPGHKEFLKNMLTGASHADVAVSVISAVDGIQEQTRRHLFLLKLIGIKTIFVAVNKMDAIDYNEKQFTTIRSDVKKFLKSIGYLNSTIIPISAMDGENVFKRSELMPWYTGPTLIESLDNVKLNESCQTTRFVVQDIYDVDSKSVVVGRLDSGSLRVGEILFFAPSGVKGEVKQIVVFGRDLDKAEKGDSIGIVTNCHVKRGDVGGLLKNRPNAVKEFLGESVFLEDGVKVGDTLSIRCGTSNVQCKIKEIREKINSETGQVVEESAEKVNEDEAATIVFSTEPVVVEKFSDIPELGRFVLYKDRNIGVGVVLDA
ncbi:MAG: GTP-binding protein [Thaumarchaeota archaeon]|nr:GTP-binding protein [Nitrososphaerota archaeon]MCL5318586.1 GTP-binding protein [Nitrososphaerota archaeon]